MSMLQSPIAPPDDPAQEAALLKTEAVLRVLKGRTTVEQEAARLQVDAMLVRGWLESTYRAICYASEQDLMRSTSIERHGDGAGTRGAPSAANGF